MPQHDSDSALEDCPLCRSVEVLAYHSDKTRSYLHCSQCQLVFVPRQFHLSPENEKAAYDNHQNSPTDSGYRKFLSRLAQPLLAQIAPNSLGLDFGSGPGPTLSLMLEEQGHRVAIYDPYYAPDEAALSRSYDFITSTEVVEHLAAPGFEMEKLWALLKPGGYLAIMTKQVTDRESFGLWHYKNDPTHISFFSNRSFQYLGNKWDSAPAFIGADVIIFRKPLES